MTNMSEHVTVGDAAAMLGIHAQTVRTWLRDGRLKGTRIGGTKSGYRIPRSEIDRVLREGTNANKA